MGTKLKLPAEVIICREGEEAERRIKAGLAEPGDGFKLAKAGLDDPERQEADKARKEGVALRMQQRGTDEEYREVRDAFNAATVANGQIVADCDSELAKLLPRVKQLQATKRAAQDDTEIKQSQFEARQKAHLWLQSDDAMPPLIRVEIQAQRTSMRNATSQRVYELSTLVQNLRADGRRLLSSTHQRPEYAGDTGTIINEHLLTQYVSEASGNAKHRAHEFWRDRVFSMAEWGNFAKWCTARADKLQAELDTIKARMEADILEATQGLSSFYAADVP